MMLTDSLSIPIPVHTQLWESVLHSLRLAIVTGALATGTHLVETELASKLGVSRGPIRDALKRLEHEGLVVNYPYRGRFVAGLSDEDIHEVYDLIRLLECRAIESLVQRVDPAQIKQLHGLKGRMIQAISEGRNEDFADLDVEFHRQLVEMSQRERLLHMWGTLSGISHAFIVINARNDPEGIRGIAEGHDQILDALARHDTAAACRALHDHLDAAERGLLGTKAGSIPGRTW